MNEKEEFISAKEAANLLGIKKGSLYTYVSRQLIQSVDDPKDKKAKLYRYADIKKFLERKNSPTTERIVKQSLLWGLPILESGITLIENEVLFYRGISVANLVKKYNFEQVASLIWTGNVSNADKFFTNRADLIIDNNLTLNRQEIQKFLLELDKTDIQSRAIADTPDLGAKIILSIVNSLTKINSNDLIENKLALRYCPKHKQAPDLIRTVLVLMADHELNSSSFTARVVASTGANLYQIINAGFAALSGYKHGANIFKVEAMIQELIGTKAQNNQLAFEKNLRARLDRGDQIVGFGHPLYPSGDYRAPILLDRIEQVFSSSTDFQILKKIKNLCQESSKNEPNIDFALVSLAIVLDQTGEFAFFLFALGRIVGWIGHAIEEYAENRLIRPRAKYIGPRPS